MTRTAVSALRLKVFVGAFAAVATLGACSDKLEEGKACPLLCPQEFVNVTDTVITSVAIDTSIGGFPTIGNETYLLLADLGDTLDTRVIVRFDTLPTTFRKAGSVTDSTITAVDSARLTVRVIRPTITRTAPITIELFDVDTTGVDTAAAPVLARFRPDTKIGERVFAPADTMGDTLAIPVSNSFVLATLTQGKRFRVGMRVSSDQSVQLRVLSTGLSAPTTLSFRATPDTSTARVVVNPVSRTPPDTSFIRDPLADYVVVARGMPAPPSGQFAIGGYPAHRAYMRFDIPQRILDSTTIIRASLILQQASFVGGPGATDSLLVSVAPLNASAAVTDIGRALTFLGGGVLDTLRLIPSGTGERRLELVTLLRIWRGTDPARTPRALALISQNEAELPQQIRFFSSETGALRPMLQITYVPRVDIGLP